MSRVMPLAPVFEHEPYISVRPFANKKLRFIFRHSTFWIMFQI